MFVFHTEEIPLMATVKQHAKHDTVHRKSRSLEPINSARDGRRLMLDAPKHLQPSNQQQQCLLVHGEAE